MCARTSISGLTDYLVLWLSEVCVSRDRRPARGEKGLPLGDNASSGAPAVQAVDAQSQMALALGDPFVDASEALIYAGEAVPHLLPDLRQGPAELGEPAFGLARERVELSFQCVELAVVPLEKGDHDGTRGDDQRCENGLHVDAFPADAGEADRTVPRTSTPEGDVVQAPRLRASPSRATTSS